ncbi:MAG TPA: hypothetical protein PK280_00340 [Planctomycetota bacterium]|nr:hypothetical protein [Planctomycetota bacterium]
MDADLNSRLAAIGFRLAGVAVPRRARAEDIERALLDAAAVARSDGRLLSLLFSWVHVHAERVNVDRLRGLLRAAEGSGDARLVVSALAAYALSRGRHRWKKLISAPAKPTQLSSSAAAPSAVEFKGAEPWLAAHRILTAKGSLRIRPADVLSVEELAKSNRQYRNRLLYGACWRADIVTAIEEGAETAAEIRSRVGCSYEPAHRVRREYLIAVGA